MSSAKRTQDVQDSGDGPTKAKRQVPVEKESSENEVSEVPEQEDFVLHNIDGWIEENEEYFQPPVCNKLMHEDGQLKVFFVGGPNQRKDYHIEDGEELFYMVTGDMCLKVIEQGKHRDIVIKEGQIFLLPARIAHSPQRDEGTVGLVIERERDTEEKDGLRYFVEKDGKLSTETLYEKWFHCDDLGPQLAAIIKEFFKTEQCKTGKPIEGTISDNPPIILDDKIKIQDPFNLKDWINEHRDKLTTDGKLTLYGNGSQFEVIVYGKGEFSGQRDGLETFLWQLEGDCEVTVEDSEPWAMEENDSMLVKAGKSYKGSNTAESLTLVCYQDPSNKKKG